MTDSPTPDYLFAYCERAGDAGLWAEPLNFITNAAFLLFAIAGAKLLARQPERSFRAIGDVWLLCFFMVLIGLGSALWHSWAAPGWTVIVDTIPIYLFINLYIFSMYRRLAAWPYGKILILWATFTAISTLIQQTMPMDTLHGSLMYIPTLGLMLLSGIYLKLANKRAGADMIALSGLFLLSLTFRTIDLELCESIAIGTHFIWHILNALLLYRLTVVLLPSRG